MQDQLFQPLAARLRPKALEQYHGQVHLLGPGKPLRVMLEQGAVHSMILWGPPGTGKTTLAKLLSENAQLPLEQISAVLSGVKDLRDIAGKATKNHTETGKPTVLFVDEIHRFNKSQQDAFLPYVEEGAIVLIGATTENPSFELNNALLSRIKVYVLKTLGDEELKAIVKHAISDKKGYGGQSVSLTHDAVELLVQYADGDARRLLGDLEIIVESSEDLKEVDAEQVKSTLLNRNNRFDKMGDQFYDLISALHKSVRGSSPDAALYWFARMIDGGCDPLYIARRVVRMASEDIGNADPRALTIALNAWEVQERLGSPEGELAIAQAIVFLATAAKSNAVYLAYDKALADVKSYGTLEVPLHLRNAPTKLMKELGYAKSYRYAHDEPYGYAAGENYFPEQLKGKGYYFPVDRGLEIKIKNKLEQLSELDEKAK